MTDITKKSDNDVIYNLSDCQEAVLFAEIVLLIILFSSCNTLLSFQKYLHSWLQLVQLCEGRLDKKIVDTNHLFEVRDETQQEIESTDSLLSVEIDEEKIGKIYKKTDPSLFGQSFLSYSPTFYNIASLHQPIYQSSSPEVSPYTRNEYTLDYNDETRSTTIQTGYRWEEEQ